MSDAAFNKTGVKLSNEDVVFICRALKANHLRLLCLRECKIGKRDFQSILKCVSACQSLQQLTLNVGIINSLEQVELLAKCINKNTSLTGLHIHGSELGDVGLQILGRALSFHPGIVSLDLGDCKLSDMAIDVLYSLLLPVNNRPGITELTLSDNPRISALGWTQFSMCLANCSSLKWLFLDYNPLGDYSASCILTGIAASQSVEILDMEGCGLTEHTGQVLLHLVQNHLGSLSRVKLSTNRIRKITVQAIRKHLSENHLDDSDTGSSITYEDLFDSETSSSRKKRSSSTSSSSSNSSTSSSSSSSSSKSSSSSSSSNSGDSDDSKGKKKKDKKVKKTKGKSDDEEFKQTVIKGLSSQLKDKDRKHGSAKEKDKAKDKSKHSDKEEVDKKKSKKDKNDSAHSEDESKSKGKDKKKDKDKHLDKEEDHKKPKKDQHGSEVEEDHESKDTKKESSTKSEKGDKKKSKKSEGEQSENEGKKGEKKKGKESKDKDEEEKKKKTKEKKNKDDKGKEKKNKDDKGKEKKNKGDKKKGESDNEDSDNEDSFGEELSEVPVFYK